MSNREQAQKPKELVDSGGLADASVKAEHLAPGLFSQLRLVGVHGHEGVTSKQLTESAFAHPPSRYVPLTNKISLISTSSPATTFTDVSVASSTSPRTFAVDLLLSYNSASVSRVLDVRPNGSADDPGHVSVNIQVASKVNRGQGICGVDNNQIFEYAADGGTDTVTIELVGYFERIS